MSKYIPGNLTLDDRIYIQNELSKGTFYNAKNFCIHRYHSKKTMPVGKSFFAVLSVLLVLPATKLVPTLNWNTVTDLIKILIRSLQTIRNWSCLCVAFTPTLIWEFSQQGTLT